MRHETPGRLPFAALEHLLRSNGRDLSVLGVDGTYIKRWREDGLDPWQADKVALSVGYFPWEVWGRSWEIAAIADELDRTRMCPCGRYFIATRRARPGKYCGDKECSVRYSRRRAAEAEQVEAVRQRELLVRTDPAARIVRDVSLLESVS